MPIATNPYHIEGPLEEDDTFAGRASVFAWIVGRLSAGERILAFYGLPRMGKTSLAHHLPSHLGDDFIYAINQIPESETWQLDRWLLGLQQDIRVALAEGEHFWDESPGQLDGKGDALSTATPSWSGLAAALGDTRLLLIIDGLSLYQEDRQNWQALLSICGELIEDGNAHVILSIQGHPLQTKALALTDLEQLPSMALDYLSEAETEALLAECAHGQLLYDYDAVRSLHQWTGGHPFVLQLFGYALYEFYSSIGRIDTHAVNGIVGQIVGAGDSLFQFIWSTLSPPARVALAALGEDHGRHELFTRRDAHDFLRWARVRIPSQHIDVALHEL